MSQLKENTQTKIEVDPHHLPLHCPTAEMLKWNAHPRVYLAIEQTGEARCPYCGTLYTLKGGPLAHGH